MAILLEYLLVSGVKLDALAWADSNVVVPDGQVAIESDTGKRKIGDGVTEWNRLIYQPVQNVASIGARVEALELRMDLNDLDIETANDELIV